MNRSTDEVDEDLKLENMLVDVLCPQYRQSVDMIDMLANSSHKSGKARSRSLTSASGGGYCPLTEIFNENQTDRSVELEMEIDVICMI